ncbi:hypothetical protein R1flu_017502 [Riccia fluitans]|uniref:Uncharacterized protein n=1 Tax=Riccia fluitans TaxID=41844 RepID=A0ABD1ZGI7_9MARC
MRRYDVFRNLKADLCLRVSTSSSILAEVATECGVPAWLMSPHSSGYLSPISFLSELQCKSILKLPSSPLEEDTRDELISFPGFLVESQVACEVCLEWEKNGTTRKNMHALIQVLPRITPVEFNVSCESFSMSYTSCTGDLPLLSSLSSCLIGISLLFSWTSPGLGSSTTFNLKRVSFSDPDC